MRTLQLEIDDKYFEKFLALLEALPKKFIKIMNNSNEIENLQKIELEKRLESYYSNKNDCISFDEFKQEFI